MASRRLTELARQYLSIVDSGDPERQLDERTNAHDAMMDAMQAEGIPFNSRFEARWIARWLVKNNSPVETPTMQVMFVKGLYANGVPEIIYNIPPEDNQSGYQPVLVVVLPFTLQTPVYERNDE